MNFANTRFSFNGIYSDDMNVSLIQIETGFLKREFGVQKTINKEKVKYNDIPIYYNAEKQTYPLSITIAKIDHSNLVYTDEDKMKIAEWLFPDDNYHEFISEDFGLIFPIQFIKAEFNDNYLSQGYITLEADMKTPYPYTIPAIAEYDLFDNETSTVIEFDNSANAVEYYFPTFDFTVLGGTTLKIKNLTLNGEEFVLNNLSINEVVTVDNHNQRIESSIGQEKISSFNFQFLRLCKGINRLQVTGKGLLRFKFSFPTMI